VDVVLELHIVVLYGLETNLITRTVCIQSQLYTRYLVLQQLLLLVLVSIEAGLDIRPLIREESNLLSLRGVLVVLLTRYLFLVRCDVLVH
jgi:hypothetical protein